MPTVSVIMPTRNAGSFLAKAVDSIVRQTLSDLELLIVDDGSTDGALDDLISKGCDARIRVFRNPRNLGIGASYAFAIPLCESAEVPAQAESTSTADLPQRQLRKFCLRQSLPGCPSG